MPAASFVRRTPSPLSANGETVPSPTKTSGCAPSAISTICGENVCPAPTVSRAGSTVCSWRRASAAVSSAASVMPAVSPVAVAIATTEAAAFGTTPPRASIEVLAASSIVVTFPEASTHARSPFRVTPTGRRPASRPLTVTSPSPTMSSVADASASVSEETVKATPSSARRTWSPAANVSEPNAMDASDAPSAQTAARCASEARTSGVVTEAANATAAVEPAFRSVSADVPAGADVNTRSPVPACSRVEAVVSVRTRSVVSPSPA